MKGFIEKLETALRVFFKIAKLLGKDTQGNAYYESRNIFMGTPKNPRRWVIYARGTIYGKVPPLWHGWMHHYASVPLPIDPSKALPIKEGVPVKKFSYQPWTPS
jgi:NADH:ubiquinone oxidoreductase subunit